MNEVVFKIFGLFDADFILALPFLTAFLWSAGGSGLKALRKYGVPLAIVGSALGYGMPWKSALIALIGMLPVISFGPGYGDKYEQKLKGIYWPYVFALGAAYSLCQIGIVLHYGGYQFYFMAACISSGTFGGSMFLSKKLGLPWKVAESLTGLSIGVLGAFIIKK